MQKWWSQEACFFWSVVDKPSNSTDVCRGRGVELSLDSTYGTSTDDLAGHVSEITSDTRVRTSVPVQNTEPGGTDPPRKANLRPSFIHRRQTCHPSFNPKVKSPSFTSSPRPALRKLQAPSSMNLSLARQQTHWLVKTKTTCYSFTSRNGPRVVSRGDMFLVV